MDKIKVLHIIGGMNRCGAETFLMNVFRNIDRNRFMFYFLCYGDKKYDYEEEIETLGGKILRIDALKQSGVKKFYKDLRNIIKKYDIDIIHAHTYFNSAIPLLVAKKEKVKIRIVHAHNTMSEYKSNILKKIYNFISKIIINRNANQFIACSVEAGKSLFFKNKDIKVIENGIDLNKFNFNEEKRKKFRDTLELSDYDLVIGHVGRFEEQKNHKFLIEIFKAILKKNIECKLLLVGDGSQFDIIKNMCKEMKIADKVIFLGNIPNVDEIMNTFDAFVFPSLFEGLGIVLIEAQANGIQCFASTEVSKEADISNKIKYIELDKTPEFWANEILNSNLAKYQIDFQDCRYNINNTVKKLVKIYTKDNKE